MTKRPASLEFTRKIKAAAFKRANGHCEACGLPFKGGAEYDHVLPAALGGEPTLANCRAICQPCHKLKTKDDVRTIRKADRVRDKASGAKTAKQKFPRAKPPPMCAPVSTEIPELPRRRLFA